MVIIKHRGNFNKTTKFLTRMKVLDIDSVLESYGQRGVEALREFTPKDTGETAASWGYEVGRTENGFRISWTNSHVEKGVPIALVIQYGHGTGTGGYVEGRDYINPAIQPIFDEMANRIWEEVRK